jgi:hypothetical protein
MLTPKPSGIFSSGRVAAAAGARMKVKSKKEKENSETSVRMV